MEEVRSISAGKRFALVTGANKGIGLEICHQLASEGIFVILTERDKKRGCEAVESLKSTGLSDIIFHQLDVKDAAFIKAHSGKLYILVNNAADVGLIIEVEAFRDFNGYLAVSDENAHLLKGMVWQTVDKAEECLKTNYYGTKGVTEALVPFLQLSNSARIVNVSSGYGQLMVSDKNAHLLKGVMKHTIERAGGLNTN